MFRILFFIITHLILINCADFECGIEFKPSGRIFNGTEASEFQTPWKAALFRQENYICGGVLISEDVVLTAAHCLREKGGKKTTKEDLTILLGVLDISQTENIRRQTRTASKFIIHQDWSVTTSNYNDDIAIIRLNEPVEFTIFVRPVCLWNNDLNETPNIPKVGTVSGWGATETFGGFVNKARIVEVPILELTQCLLERDLINRIAWNKSFCAGDPESGVLRGDSGSSLTVKIGEKDYLKGLVSSAIYSPKTISYLAVYSDVTLYDDFIKENMVQIPINLRCKSNEEVKYGFYGVYGCYLNENSKTESFGNVDIKINHEKEENENNEVEILVIKSRFIVFPRNFMDDNFPNLKILSIQYAIPKEDPYQMFYLERKHFKEFRNIETLFIHSKFEGKIPDDLFYDLVKVQNVRIRFNNFHELPKTLFNKMISLNILHLGNNKIVKIPSELFSKNLKLEHLNLSVNKIDNLDEKLFENSQSLSKIEIAKNKIKILPEKLFSKCQELKYLDLSHNEIEIVPKNLFENNFGLRDLILSYNKITKILVEPKVFSQFNKISFGHNNCFDGYFWKGHDEQIMDFEKRIKNSLTSCV